MRFWDGKVSDLMKKGTARYHSLALVIVVMWSSTFVSTKVLLGSFSPIEILIIRFTVAWALMFAVYPHMHRVTDVRTELRIALAGVMGGSLYFLAENYALTFSLASNVSLLVSTAPILTAIAAHHALRDERISRFTIFGALVSFCGVALVIFNGTFVLKLNPAGDLLALASSASWAIYSITIKKLSPALPGAYVTRKIFFYTVITTLPALFFTPFRPNLTLLLSPTVALNMAFLAIVASCVAYVSWNAVIRKLGAVRANTYIYFIPLLTLVESALLLGEPITPFALLGAGLILSGVWIASKRGSGKRAA